MERKEEEEEPSLWVQTEEDIPELKRKGLFYRLPGGGVNFGVNDNLLAAYCKPGDLYVELSQKLCGTMALSLAKEADQEVERLEYPIYLSLTFLKDTSQPDLKVHYDWRTKRRIDGNSGKIEIEKGEVGGEKKDSQEHESYEKWKANYSQHRTLRAEAVVRRGGFQMPVRLVDGRAKFVELVDRFAAILNDRHWKSLFTAGTSLWKFDGHTASSRSIDRYVTVYIEPWLWENFHFKGVRFENVEAAFSELKSKKKKLKAKYVMRLPEGARENSGNWRLVSRNPFCFYETWMSTADFAECIRQERILPEMTKEIETYLVKLQKKMKPTEKDDKIMERLKGKEGTIRTQIGEKGRNGIIGLSANRMKPPKRESNQNTVMGVPAPDIAKDAFKWDPKDPSSSSNNIAEWLHISAYAYGGLMNEKEAWLTSQIQTNLIFGTSETNSLMFRHEMAWMTLFKMEQDYRSMAKPGDFDSRDVTGSLNYNEGFGSGKDLERWQQFSRHAPWLVRELSYSMSMDGKSQLLDNNAMGTIDSFFAFKRPFFTTGEAIVDIALLKGVYDERMGQVGAKNEEETPEKKKVFNPKKGTNHLAVLEDLVPPGVGKASVQDPSTAYPGPLSQLEQQLTSADNIGQLDSLDNLVLHCTGFRESLIPEPTAPVSATTAFSEMKVSKRSAPSRKISVDTPKQYHVPEHVTITIGGLPLRNISLVICNAQGQYVDLPVVLRTINTPATHTGLLLTPSTTTTPPILVLSASSPHPDIQLVGSPLASPDHVVDLATQTSSTEFQTSLVPSYILKGTVASVFGIPFLNGTLYAFHSSSSPLPTQEILQLDLLDSPAPLTKLLPFLPDSISENIPLKNIQFTYSPDVDDFLNPVGLCIEADLTFTGPLLRPVGESIEWLFRDHKDKPPTGLHIAARLSRERDWSRLPEVGGFKMRGELGIKGERMELWLGDVLNFRKLGVEITLSQGMRMNGDGVPKPSWEVGWGLFGELEIHGIPGMILPLEITAVEFNTSFRTTALRESFAIGVSGFMKFGDADIFLSGHYSKGRFLASIAPSHTVADVRCFITAETCFEAEIGNMTWADVMKAYRQLMGKPVEEPEHDPNIKFEQISLRLSTKGFALRGKVSFNDKTSVHGYVTFGEEGLAIGGGIADFTVPGAEIEIGNAELDIFIGAKDSGKDSGKGVGRPTKFALKGMIEFQGIKFAAGLEASTDGSSDSRRWIVYGSYQKELRLSDLKAAKHLKGTSLDIALKSVAVIASNEKGTWINPVSEIQYPVVKGISLFASIEPLDAINELAKGKKVDDLMLIASINPSDGVVSVGIQLPEAIGIEMGDIAEIKKFSVGINISSNPYLALRCDVKVKMGKQPDLTLHAKFEASATSAKGSLWLDENVPWKNPYGVSDQVEIHGLGAGIGFSYATVFATGPSELAFKGEAHCGKNLKLSATTLVSNNPAVQLLELKLDGLNVSKVIRFAGELADSSTLRDLQLREDLLVFKIAGLYFSTGVEVFDKTYPAGMSARGGITVLGKDADFTASVGKKGFELKGNVDPFVIGPLEVRSASGAPRAKLEIEMTTRKQAVLIDGVVAIRGSDGKKGIELGALVDAKVNPVGFDVWVFVKFGDKINFDLKAVAKKVPKDLRRLAEAEVKFELLLDGDVLEAFCDGVLGFLDELQNLATASAEALETGLQWRLDEVSREVEARSKQLEALRARVKEKQEERDRLMAEAEKARMSAEKEIEDLKREFDGAVANKDSIKAQLEEKVEQAKLDRKAAEARKCREYDAELKKATEEQDRTQREKSDLEGQKKLRYGDVMTAITALESKLKGYKTELDGHRNALNFAENSLDRLGPFDKALAKLGLRGLRELVNTAEKKVTECQNDVRNTKRALETPAFQALEIDIGVSVAQYNKATNMLDGLRNQGVEGFIKATLKDEDAEIAKRKRELDAQMAGNSKLMTAIQEAQAKLDSRKPDLLRIIEEEDAKVAKAKDDLMLRDLEEKLTSARQEESEKRMQKELIGAGAKLIQEEVGKGTAKARALVQGLKQIEIRIKRVFIEADGQKLIQGGAMEFSVMVEYKGHHFPVEEKWAPLQKPAELYRDLMKKVLEKVKEV
ncbi:hypothetical protein OQA88_9281 [Cercophora sp. LCS_1]